MAWIAIVPPSPRHPHERYQVCYQEGKRHRSAGIFLTERRALAEKRALERRQCEQAPAPADLDLERARTPVRRVRGHEVVAGLEGPAPHLRIRHPQKGREAHPAHLREHPPR